MFVKSVSASNLRDNMKEGMELVKDKDALQILHKSGLKVIISQGYFLEMVGKLAAYEGVPTKTVKGPSLDDLDAFMAEGVKLAEERKRILEEEEAEDDGVEGVDGRLGRSRREKAR